MSDLRFDVQGRSLLIGFGGGSDNWRSDLVDARGDEMHTGTRIHVAGLYSQDGSKPLEWRLGDIVVTDEPTLDDPAGLFLETLHQIVVPAGPTRAPGLLRLGESTFLLPLRRALLDRFAGVPIRVVGAGEVPEAGAITIRGTQTTTTLDVDLFFPVRKGRFVRARRRFDRQADVQRDESAPYFLLWPDFRAPDWNEYFFFAYRGPTSTLDLEPVVAAEAPYERQRSDGATSRWWRSQRPAEVLAATARGAEAGLVLGPFQEDHGPANRNWELSVDLGSTHTRVFSLEGNGKPREMAFGARALQVIGHTDDKGKIDQPFDNEFFRLRGSLPPELTPMNELPTQVITPKDTQATGRKEPWLDGWLPADGLAVCGQYLREFKIDASWQHFSTDIKWSLGRDRDEEDLSGPSGNWRTGVFLAHVLVMARAEAAAQGARVTRIGYAHPSSFPRLLEDNLANRWAALLRDTGIDDGGSEVEAAAVADYLTDFESAPAAAGLLAIDIGGSTSDIAIWHHNQPRCLESVRFAASAIAAWLCTDDCWPAYCRILSGLGLDSDNWVTYGRQDWRGLADVPAAERLPFLYISFAEVDRKAGCLGDLINELSRKAEQRRFLRHISFIFAGLLYYLGLLQRGLLASAAAEHPAHGYTLRFCGKGATFLRWLEPDGEWPVLEDVFLAGLAGPAGAPATVPVRFEMSQKPKHEVGYGRLIRALDLGTGSAGRGDRREPRPVRAAEAGYGGLDAHDDLSADALERLVEKGPDAVPADFPELETFLEAWSKSVFGASKLRVPSSAIRERVVQRIYGHVRGCIAYQLDDDDRRHELTIDPLFLLECKAFYEAATGVKPELWIGRING